MVSRNLFKVPGLWVKLCRYAKNAPDHPEQEQERYDLIRHILTLGVTSGNIHMEVTGLENLPEEDGFLIYANHQGLFDCVALVYSCPRPLAAVCKKELKGIPFVEQVRLCTNSFCMDREDVRQSMTVINVVIKEVKAGRNYLIFPEGTRSRKGNEMLEFHSGSFKCALKAKCPVVPIAFIDSFKVLDEKGCKPVSVQIHYLEPISYEEYKDMNTTELANLVRGKIEAVINEHKK
jgi:1-acyl-sn-glycerol-3-phosphate acyltransferase